MWVSRGAAHGGQSWGRPTWVNRGCCPRGSVGAAHVGQWGLPTWVSGQPTWVGHDARVAGCCGQLTKPWTGRWRNGETGDVLQGLPTACSPANSGATTTVFLLSFFFGLSARRFAAPRRAGCSCGVGIRRCRHHRCRPHRCRPHRCRPHRCRPCRCRPHLCRRCHCSWSFRLDRRRRCRDRRALRRAST